MNMNELIKVNNETQKVSARELHKSVGSTERFSAWFERQLQYGFVEGADYTTVKVLTEVQNNGGIQERELTDYEISVEMAKEICMVQRNEKARKVRQYLIDLEKAWNTPEQVFARALKMAEKTIESLKSSNAALEENVERMRPKEIFADAVSASDSSILVRDLAKIIKQNGKQIGEKRLYKWLRENGYICKGTTTPTQKAMELGLFEIVVRTVDRGNGLPIETKTTKVTGKGQQYFINKFLGAEPA
jgi:anti-repressor protein